MSKISAMYSKLVEDAFPDQISLQLGDQTLTYQKRVWNLEGERRGLRYGENPDQPAALYELQQGSLNLDGQKWRLPGQGIVSGLTEQDMLQAGKHPGKINLTDVDNGANILQYLTDTPAAVILKHNNPSGAAKADNLAEAVLKAYLGDRIAAYGGAVVVNRSLDKDTASFLAENYFEVVAAPDYEEGAVEILKSRKNLRIMRLKALGRLEEYRDAAFLDIKSLFDGGLILQKSFGNRIACAADFLPAQAENKEGASVIARRPDQREMDDLLFAWAVEAGVTSNSVIFAKDGATVAIGTGEQDRVGVVELTAAKARTKYADLLAFNELGKSIYELRLLAAHDSQAKAKLDLIQNMAEEARGGLPGSVLVSDGFFPFRDGVDLTIAQGVTAIAQPGGSIRDFEVIAACNEACPPVAMVFTGQRSFRH